MSFSQYRATSVRPIDMWHSVSTVRDNLVVSAEAGGPSLQLLSRRLPTNEAATPVPGRPTDVIRLQSSASRDLIPPDGSPPNAVLLCPDQRADNDGRRCLPRLSGRTGPSAQPARAADTSGLPGICPARPSHRRLSGSSVAALVTGSAPLGCRGSVPLD